MSWIDGIALMAASVVARIRGVPFVPILVYHCVLPTDDPAHHLLGTRTHNVRPEVFREHVELLKRHFDVVSVDELADRARTGRSLRGLAAVTFDDGYRSVFDYAVPVLEELGIPATLFLTGRLIETGSFWRDSVRQVVESGRIEAFLAHAASLGLDVEDVRRDAAGFYRDTKRPGGLNTVALAGALDGFLVQAGSREEERLDGLFCRPADIESWDVDGSAALSFGNHGFGHHVLSSLTADQQRRDIEYGESLLRKLGLPISRVFSIPFGGVGCVSAETEAALGDAGYTGYLLSSGHGRTGDIRNRLAVLSRVMPPDATGALTKMLMGQAVRG